jgi:hypothetical protein
MGVVVKITLPSCGAAPPQWFGPHADDISKCVVPRDAARVFLTPAEAEAEIDRFRFQVPPDAFLFEIETI